MEIDRRPDPVTKRFTPGLLRVILDMGDVCGDYDCLDADDLAIDHTLPEVGGQTLNEVFARSVEIYWLEENRINAEGE